MTNPEIIAAVARAIFAEFARHAAIAEPARAYPAWEELTNDARAMGHSVARAAIRALAACEPSYAMRMAGLCAICTEDMEASDDKISRYMHTELESAACWRAMLAELVKE